MRKRQRNIIQVAIMILIILSACSRENKIWDLVKMNNDISSFEFYKENYPRGKYLDSAEFYIDNLSELHKSKPLIISQEITFPIASWDNKVCEEIGLQISVSFPQQREFEKKYRERVFNIIKEDFEQRGIKTVPLNDNCETKLLINVKMKTYPGTYERIGLVYTGYDFEATYLLMTDDKAPIRASIYKERPVAEFIYRYAGYDGSKPFHGVPDVSILLDPTFTSKLWYNSDSLSLNTKIPDYYINYIYQLFCNQDSRDRYHAIQIMTSDNFELKPEVIIPLFTYNLSNDTSLQRLSGGYDFEILRKMGVDAIDVAPILIEYIAFRNSQGWDYDDVEEILEFITGYKNNYVLNKVSKWREWWFNYKCPGLVD